MRLESFGNSRSQRSLSGPGRVKTEIREIEGKLRRGVRAVAKHVSATFHHDDAEEVPKTKVRQGIVSINGQDVERMQCTGRKRS
jgi:hypothetical protein